jgi:hypothetical protein
MKRKIKTGVKHGVFEIKKIKYHISTDVCHKHDIVEVKNTLNGSTYVTTRGSISSMNNYYKRKARLEALESAFVALSKTIDNIKKA